MARFARTVSTSFSARTRQGWELHAEGLARSDAAVRLGVSERTVKREIEEIPQAAWEALAGLARSGCAGDAGLIVGYASGNATAVKAGRAELRVGDPAELES